MKLTGDVEAKERVREQFSPVAARYAVNPVLVSGPDLDAMLAAAGLSGRERVLDVGCGAGHTALAFARHAREVVALDLCGAMLEEARRLAGERGLANVRFELGDAERIPLETASFQLVTSRMSAHHFPDPRRALREIARVLRPGGSLLLVDSVSPEDTEQAEFLDRIERERDPSHVRDWRVSEWETMLGEAGFEPTLLGTWLLPLDFDAWVTRMQTPPGAVARLKRLMDTAPAEVKEAFGIAGGGDYSWRIPAALLRAALPR